MRCIQAAKLVPGDEARLGAERVAHGVLHQVLGGRAVAGQRQRLDAQLGQDRDDLIVEEGVHQPAFSFQ